MKDDDARKKILARRASFIAAALASVACHKDPVDKPEPCLAVPVGYDPDAAPPIPPPPEDSGLMGALEEPTPMPCLSIAPPRDDGGAIGPDALGTKPPDAGRPDAGATKPKPKLVPPPPPAPCLTPARPGDPGTVQPRPCLSPPKPSKDDI